MAKLDPRPYPGDWELKVISGNIDKWLKDQAAQVAAIPNVIKFPVADGYALYHVKSEKPLVLQHIPYMDGYSIPAAHIRGLTLADVRQMLEREKNLAKLFGGARFP
jgi:hypothetical protein